MKQNDMMIAKLEAKFGVRPWERALGDIWFYLRNPRDIVWRHLAERQLRRLLAGDIPGAAGCDQPGGRQGRVSHALRGPAERAPGVEGRA